MKSELQKALEKYQKTLAVLASETRSAVGGREKHGIASQRKISANTGYNPRALSQWINGKKRSLNWIVRLAQKICKAQKEKKL